MSSSDRRVSPPDRWGGNQDEEAARGSFSDCGNRRFDSRRGEMNIERGRRDSVGSQMSVGSSGNRTNSNWSQRGQQRQPPDRRTPRGDGHNNNNQMRNNNGGSARDEGQLHWQRRVINKYYGVSCLG